MKYEISDNAIRDGLENGSMTLKVREHPVLPPGEYRLTDWHAYPDYTWDIVVERIGD